MQMEILFINPLNAGQYWKTVSSKSNYCEKKKNACAWKAEGKFPIVYGRPRGSSPPHPSQTNIYSVSVFNCDDKPLLP